ncbi:MAG: Na+/H+ antiporter subunit E [Calditrichaeota bacterium]|nr:Na+/H+ antiporter subunit E [Calditrichota bacterium]
MTFLYTFLIMFAFWILLSGKFDVFHLSLGVISSALIAYISRDLIFTEKNKKGRLAEAFRFIGYFPWLIYQVIVANLSVAYLVLHPKMIDLIDPQIIWFKSGLKKDISLVTLGNSITLTPGTITVRIVDGEFYVHTLHPKFTELISEKMEKRVANIFNETL